MNLDEKQKYSPNHKLFSKDFLEELQDNCGALTMVDHYIDDLGMSFHEAILRFANHHSIKPRYIEKQ